MNHRPARGLAFALVILAAAPCSALRAQTPDAEWTRLVRLLDSLRRTNPQEYASTRTLIITTAQMALARLGFGPVGLSGVIDSSTTGAVRRFERARHLTITGDPFTRATLERIVGDIDRITKSEQRPYLGLKTFSWAASWLIAEGPWLMEGEPETYMVLHIYCDRGSAQCNLSWARLGNAFLVGRQLQVLTETFQIVQWDDAEILSQPLDYPCTRYLLRVNRVQESVVMTRSTISKGDECKGMEVRDLVTRLVKAEEWPKSDSGGGNLLELFNLGPAARSALNPKPH